MSDEISFHTQFDCHVDGHLLALYQLQAGPDPAAALTIFRYLRDQLSSGEHLDPAVLDSYLLPALERIIESANPSNEVAKAFGFKAEGRGQYKRPDTFERDWLMAIHVEIRYQEILEEKNRPGSRESPRARAFIEVGERFHVEASAVRDVYRKYRHGGHSDHLLNPLSVIEGDRVKPKGLSEMSMEELHKLLKIAEQP